MKTVALITPAFALLDTSWQSKHKYT